MIVVGAVLLIIVIGAAATRIPNWTGFRSYAPPGKVHHVEDSPGFEASSYTNAIRAMHAIEREHGYTTHTRRQAEERTYERLQESAETMWAHSQEVMAQQEEDASKWATDAGRARLINRRDQARRDRRDR